MTVSFPISAFICMLSMRMCIYYVLVNFHDMLSLHACMVFNMPSARSPEDGPPNSVGAVKTDHG